MQFESWHGFVIFAGVAVAAFLLGRRWSSFSFFRMATLAFVCLAIANPYYETTHETSNATVLVDISESMDEAIAERLLKSIRRFSDAGVHVDYIPFARESGRTPVSDAMFKSLKNAWFKLDVGQTDLEKALRAVMTQPAGSVLLVSDGFETTGNARKSLDALKERGFHLFPLVDETPITTRGFTVSNLYAPLIAPTQKSVDIRVSLANATATIQPGTLEITHDGKVVLARPVTVKPGEEFLAIAESDPSKEGIREITATLRPNDPKLAPSSRTIYLSGQGREKVLLINGAEEDGRFLGQVLKDQSYQLKVVQAGDRNVPLPDFSDYSAVIWNNVAKNQLPGDAITKLDRYVKGGGGFVMLGGNRSFGLGGYLDTPMEQILPVQILPPQTIKKRLNVAVALVLDKSRSMGFGDRIEFAKEGAREVIRNLKDDDYVTVIGFDSAPFVVVKLGQVGTIREDAIERVGRLFPNNKTNLLPALDEARRALMRANAGRKHMIVLTDGRIPDSGPYYIELVKQLRLLGITVSTVLVGGEADDGLLSNMAQQGGGAFYQTADPRSLPRIFLSDIKVSTGEQSMKEAQEYLVRNGPEPVSTTIRTFPPLRGYVETKAKEKANLELVAYAEEKAEPLLASWSYGQGKSVAFTSDANGRWSNYWINWSKFQNFWTEILDSVRPRNHEQESIPFDLRSYYEHGVLNFDLSVFNEKVGGAVTAQVILPNGTVREVSFHSVAPGRYQSSVSDVLPGKYEFKARVGSRSLTPVAMYLSGELFGEQKGQGFNRSFLELLASETGGKVNPDIADIKDQIYIEREKHDLGHWFLVLALLTLCCDVILREIGGWRRVFQRRKGALARA